MQVETLGRYSLLLWRLGIYRRKWAEFWSSFKQNKAALFGMGIFLLFLVLALFPQIFSSSPYLTVGEPMQPPSISHIFGTDNMGRDVLSQVVYGTRVSMFVGFTAAFATIVIGGVIGLISGYYGGSVERVLMGFTEFFLAIPALPLMIVIAAILTPSLWNIIFVITITSWASTAKITRSQTLSLKERLYVKRAKGIGCSDFRILYGYIMPGVLPVIFATMVLMIGWAIPSEAILAWLGLGDINTLSWGMILYYAFNQGGFIEGVWWYFIPPGICILLATMGFSLIGRGMQDALNPKLRKL